MTVRTPANLSQPLASCALIALLLMFCLLTSHAQPGTPVWTNRYKGSGYDVPIAMAVDGTGNVAVLGYSSGDYVTIAYSSQGLPLWTNRYNGPGNGDDYPYGVTVASNGNVYVTGVSAGSSGVFDYATIAYSIDGAPLWTNRYNGPANGHDFGFAVAVDRNGNLFVTGHSAGDCTTIAYSSAGSALWTNHYRGPGNVDDSPKAIVVDDNGNVYVTGTSSTVGYEEAPTIAYSNQGIPLWTNRYGGQLNAMTIDGNGNVVVAGQSSAGEFATIAYSNLGVPLWTNRYNAPGVGPDFVTSVAADKSGKIFVTGSTFRSGNFDYATIAYSTAGTALWTNLFNGSNNDYDEPCAVAVDGKGRVVVSGYTTINVDSEDYLTIAYSSSGETLWTRSYDGPDNSHDTAKAMVIDNNGDILVTGFSYDNVSGSVDIVTIKYSTLPIPLEIHRLDNQIVLNWTNTAFSLQSATIVHGNYTNIVGATSPYTNLISGDQQYFRLIAN